MDDELEVIHSEMEATRKSLAGKLIEVETQIREGVAVAGDTVTHTVESVKDAVTSVTETVSSVKEGVKETFNVRKHVENHPLGAVGTAFAAGFVGGLFIGPAKTPAAAPASGATSSGGSLSGGAWSGGSAATAAAPAAAHPYTPSPSPAPASARREPGVFDAIFGQLQGLAVSALTKVAHNLVKEASPPDWQSGLTKVIDDISAQLKGEPKPARGWKDGLSELMETVTTQLTTPKSSTDGSNSNDASQRKGPTQEVNPAWTGPAARPHEAHGARGR